MAGPLDGLDLDAPSTSTNATKQTTTTTTSGPLTGFDPNATPVQGGAVQKTTDSTNVLANYGYDPQQHSVGENLSHLWSNPVQHIESTGMPDAMRVAGNSLGLGDWLHSTVTGLTHPLSGIEAQKADWEAQQAQTKEASQRIGPVASVGANLLGSAPLAAAGTGATTADALTSLAPRLLSQGVGRWGAGVVGSAAENAGLSALSAGAQGEDPIAAAKMGAITGSVAGLPGGVASRLPVRGPLASSSDLRATASGVNSALEGVHFDPNDVERSFNGVGYNLSKGDKAGMGGPLKGTVDDISRAIGEGGSVTADDMAKFQRSLFDSAGSANDYRLATKYANGLNDTLANARPWVGAAPGEAKGMVDAANLASSRANTGADIEGWLRNPGAAPAQVGKALENQPQFYNKVPGLTDALTDISQIGTGSPMSGWYLHHYLGPALVQGGLGALGGGASAAGEGDLTHVLERAGLGFVAGSALGGTATAMQRARVANALKNAQYLAQTGQRVATPTPGRDLLQLIARSQGIAGPNAANQ